MFNEGRPQNENSDMETASKPASPESDPEKTVGGLLDSTITPAENKDSKDPVISSEWGQKAKKFFKKSADLGGKTAKYTAYGAGILAGGGLLWILKDFYLVWKFAQKLIEKKGNMTFADGQKIAEDAFSSLGIESGKKN